MVNLTCSVKPSCGMTQFYREEYLAPIPESERDDMLEAYHHRLSSPDERIALTAAKAWAKWE